MNTISDDSHSRHTYVRREGHVIAFVLVLE